MLVVEARLEPRLEEGARSGLLTRRLKNSDAAREAVSTRRLLRRLKQKGEKSDFLMSHCFAIVCTTGTRTMCIWIKCLFTAPVSDWLGKGDSKLHTRTLERGVKQ